ncbi:MAG: DsrE family protein [Anaerolineae bacterium]|nr:DsrE family protein [Anaerolineae bacterium]
MNVLIIINDAPYGSEKAYNALRLALALQKDHAEVQVRVFLMADAVTCALPGQKTPDGYYNLERMLKGVVTRGGLVKACGTCADARGIRELSLVEGVEVSTMSQLAQWVVEADKVLTF